MKLWEALELDEARYKQWAAGKPDDEVRAAVRAWDAEHNPRPKKEKK